MKGSIRQRTKGTWELTIDLGKDTAGKRRRKFFQVKGPKSAAQRRLRELLGELDKGISIGDQKITFGQWLSKWLAEYVTPNTRQKTIERYTGLIKKHIKPTLGMIDITKVTPSDIQGLESELSKQGMAPQGVHLVHNVISGAFKFALKMEVAWRNPAKSVTPPKITRDEVQPPEITKIKGILSLAKEQRHPMFACLHLMAFTGIRRGEALALRHQDLNLEAGTISIVQSLGRSLKGLIVEPTKTRAGRRSLNIDADTVTVLRGHLGDQLLQRMELGNAYQDNGLVFPGPLGEPHNPMKLTRSFQALAKKQGIQGAKLHDLRHFHATILLQNGESLLLVARRLGHASVSTTGDVYAHLLPGWQKEAADGFARVMREA